MKRVFFLMLVFFYFIYTFYSSVWELFFPIIIVDSGFFNFFKPLKSSVEFGLFDLIAFSFVFLCLYCLVSFLLRYFTLGWVIGVRLIDCDDEFNVDYEVKLHNGLFINYFRFKILRESDDIPLLSDREIKMLLNRSIYFNNSFYRILSSMFRRRRFNNERGIVCYTSLKYTSEGLIKLTKDLKFRQIGYSIKDMDFSTVDMVKEKYSILIVSISVGSVSLTA